MRKLGGILYALPVWLPAALAAFSVVVVAHLLIGRFQVRLVLPFGILAAGVAGYYAHKLSYSGSPGDADADSIFVDGLVLAGIVLWLLFNLLFTSQHLLTNRDPATYNLAGTWLINHQSIEMEKPAALADLDVPGLQSESLGFAADPEDSDILHAQGTHILPALQALAGKMFGVEGMLRANVLFGATALLAFYGFSRMVVRPRWAALGVLVMASSLPMLFMTRDSYTEPLSMTFLFGGLSLLAYAWPRRIPWQWWLAGLVLGAAALTRIDAYLVFAGILLALIILLMMTPQPQRHKTLGCVAWLCVGTALAGYIAWLDVALLSTNYYQAHRQFIVPELYLLAGLSIVGAAAIILNWRFDILPVLDRMTHRWRENIMVIGISIFFLVLTSRPLWFVGYHRPDGVLGPRTFSEQTMNWIIWYIGPVLLAAGILGLALVVNRVLRGKDRYLLPFVLALSVTAFLYLLRPSITGDQVWATRRLLPIVIPGFVLLGMWLFGRLFDYRVLPWRGRYYNLEIIVTVLVTLSVVSPLFVTYPFVARRLYVPQLTQMQAVCQKLPPDAVVVWAGEARLFVTQPTRVVCGNDSLGLVLSDKTADRANLATLYQQAEASGMLVVVGFFETDAPGLPLASSQKAMTVSNISYHEIEHTYKRAPRNMITIDSTILMGELGTGGISPLR